MHSRYWKYDQMWPISDVYLRVCWGNLEENKGYGAFYTGRRLDEVSSKPNIIHYHYHMGNNNQKF